MGKRTEEKWAMNFKQILEMLYLADKYLTNGEIENFAKLMRNPLVFDNSVADVLNPLPYYIEGVSGKTTSDHLIGMSNIVLYIIVNKIHHKWITVDDFIKTLKVMHTSIVVSTYTNNCSTFKKGWLFGVDDINECIRWDNKLKSVGVTHLKSKINGDIVSVEDVWSEWYETHKESLV